MINPHPDFTDRDGSGYALADGSAEVLQSFAEQSSRRYRSVGETAYVVIRDAILQGTLAPGQKLRQETLARIIGVSRVPVRSALIQLEAEGLVEIDDRRGAHVKSLTPEHARQIYDVRRVLEVEALRLAMSSMTPERLEALRELAVIADEENHGAGFVEARASFYSQLYDAARYPVLWETIEQLRIKVGRFVLGRRLDVAHSPSHVVLMDAVATGDPDRAASILSDHLAGVRDDVVRLLAREDDDRAAVD